MTNLPVPFTRRRAITLGLALFVCVAGCNRRAENTAPRCAFCGMRIAPGSHWTAGALSTDAARSLAFDTPACLFRYRHAHGAASTREEWVIEYYSPTDVHSDARTLRYVVGSDLVGPMGPDVVPVAAGRAEELKRDHHGRLHLGFSEITPDVIHGL